MTRVLVRQVIAEIITSEELTLEQFLSPARSRDIAWPRQRSMYVCRKVSNLSLPQIGRRHGGRDHTTVIHAIRRVEERMATDPNEAAEVARLLAVFNRASIHHLCASVASETEGLAA